MSCAHIVQFIPFSRYVDDIDLFPGGISERSVSGGLIGPTFGCIIGRQFERLRIGDRFWYENPGNDGFSPGRPYTRPADSCVCCLDYSRAYLAEIWLIIAKSCCVIDGRLFLPIVCLFWMVLSYSNLRVISWVINAFSSERKSPESFARGQLTSLS